MVQGGAVMGRAWQPHESHLPYLLQLKIDFNLSGMGWLRLSQARFRPPLPATFTRQRRGWATRHLVLESEHGADSLLPASGAQPPGSAGTPGGSASQYMRLWTVGSTPSSWLWGGSTAAAGTAGAGARGGWHGGGHGGGRLGGRVPRRQSTCQLELDAIADHILNRQQAGGCCGWLAGSCLPETSLMMCWLAEWLNGEVTKGIMLLFVLARPWCLVAARLGCAPPVQLVRVPLAGAGPEVRMVESLAPMWAEEAARCGPSGIPNPPPSPPRSPHPLSHAVHAVRQQFEAIAAQQAQQEPPPPLQQQQQPEPAHAAAATPGGQQAAAAPHVPAAAEAAAATPVSPAMPSPAARCTPLVALTQPANRALLPPDGGISPSPPPFPAAAAAAAAAGADAQQDWLAPSQAQAGLVAAAGGQTPVTPASALHPRWLQQQHQQAGWQGASHGPLVDEQLLMTQLTQQQRRQEQRWPPLSQHQQEPMGGRGEGGAINQQPGALPRLQMDADAWAWLQVSQSVLPPHIDAPAGWSAVSRWHQCCQPSSVAVLAWHRCAWRAPPPTAPTAAAAAATRRMRRCWRRWPSRQTPLARPSACRSASSSSSRLAGRPTPSFWGAAAARCLAAPQPPSRCVVQGPQAPADQPPVWDPDADSFPSC